MLSTLWYLYIYLTRNHQDCRGWFRFPYCQRKGRNKKCALGSLLGNFFPFFHSVAPPGHQMRQNTTKGMGIVTHEHNPVPGGLVTLLVSLSQLQTLRLVMPSSGVRFLLCRCCQCHKLVPFLFAAQGTAGSIRWCSGC